MQYALGIDLGTTFSAAAVGRPDGVEMVSLGHRVTAIPTVVFVDEDGRLEVGDRAEALGESRPHLLARDVKRRLGDDTPLILAGRPYSPQALLALVLRTIVARVSAEQGGPPTVLVLDPPGQLGSLQTGPAQRRRALVRCRGQRVPGRPWRRAAAQRTRGRGHLVRPPPATGPRRDRRRVRPRRRHVRRCAARPQYGEFHIGRQPLRHRAPGRDRHRLRAAPARCAARLA